MKKTYIFTAIIFVSIFMVGFIKYNRVEYTLIQGNAFGTGTVVQDSIFRRYWINNVPQNVNVFVEPADSPNFVGDNFNNNHPIDDFDRQDFFRWSHQMFYWLLSPVPTNGSCGNCGGPVFLSPAFFDATNLTFKRKRCIPIVTNDQYELQRHKKAINVGDNMSFEVKGTQKGKNNLPIILDSKTDIVYNINKLTILRKINTVKYSPKLRFARWLLTQCNKYENKHI